MACNVIERRKSDTDRVEKYGALEQQVYFHGMIPKEDVGQFLKTNGDFIVRRQSNDFRPDGTSVLSFYWDGIKHMTILRNTRGHYHIGGATFAAVSSLIYYYKKRQIPLVPQSNIKLINPIPLQNWELRHENIILKDKLGQGQFGEVYKATLVTDFGGTDVAVKTFMLPADRSESGSPTDINDSISHAQKYKFIQECRIMRGYSHPNIVNMIGMCLQRNPIMCVMELIPGGSLDVHLRNHGAVTPPIRKVSYCVDVANGMCYLEQVHCIHRDLAARNCLIGSEGIKIADFGLSRVGQIYVMTVDQHGSKVPLKWTAPESLTKNVYTSKSDVWSFGILIWEIFANGQQPFPEIPALTFIKAMQSGKGIQPSSKDLDGMYPQIDTIMLLCTKMKPNERPSFKTLKQLLSGIYNNLLPNPTFNI